MRTRRIYLAGPISLLSYDAATGWREDFASRMAESGIECASPMRAKGYLAEEGSIATEGYAALGPLSAPRGIMTRDHWDCMDCDLIVANLLGAGRVSVGTVMEIAWAHAYRKPLVVVMEPSGNPHEHPMIAEATGFRATSLEEAAAVALAVLRG